MSQQTNLQRAKKEAVEDLRREFGRDETLELWILDRVTSTYLQAVEDCRKVIAGSRTVGEKYGMGEIEMMTRAQAMVDLQSLKQTKD